MVIVCYLLIISGRIGIITSNEENTPWKCKRVFSVFIMSKKYKLLLSILAIILLQCIMLFSCHTRNVDSYNSYTLNEGTIHFSLEYPSDYIIDYYQAAAATGNNYERSAHLFLKGPANRHVNDYTYIGIGASPPDDQFDDAKSSVERVERKAATWSEYELYNKCEITIDGVPGFRIDYQIIDIVPAIAGDEPGIAVYRCVYFDAKSLVWCIYMNSSFTFAEADKIHFEHLLETFKILD